MVSVSIPNELILEILSRLPRKSIERFYCVSKLWGSMLRGPHFKEMFLTRSSAQPRLLFAIERDGLWSIFSLPQHLRPYEYSSSSLVVTAEFHMKFPPDNMTIYDRDDRRFSCGYASGLIYFYGMYLNEVDYAGVPVICNPKTGRYATLPFLQRYRRTYSFFGFDPIDKQYKVLFMSYPFGPDHHKVITLGPGEMSWKRIKRTRSLQHVSVSEGICINGIVYYLGDTSDKMTVFVIVCFDVRFEKFSYIYPESYCQLINYNGKLGLIYYDDYDDDAIEFRVWVLEDAEKQEWSKYAYTLRDDKFLDHYVSVVGVTATGEIVLSMGDYTSKQPFYVFYFNPQRNTLQRVEIQGFGEYHEALDNCSRVHVFVDDCSRFYDFVDHVEALNVNDPKLLKSNIYSLPFYSIYASEESSEDEDESSEEDEDEDESSSSEEEDEDESSEEDEDEDESSSSSSEDEDETSPEDEDEDESSSEDEDEDESSSEGDKDESSSSEEEDMKTNRHQKKKMKTNHHHIIVRRR